MGPPAAAGSPDAGAAEIRGSAARPAAPAPARRAPRGRNPPSRAGRRARPPLAPRAESDLMPGLPGPQSPACRRTAPHRRVVGRVRRSRPCPCRRSPTRAARRRRGRGPPRDRGPGGRLREDRGQRLFRETAGDLPGRRTRYGMVLPSRSRASEPALPRARRFQLPVQGPAPLTAARRWASRWPRRRKLYAPSRLCRSRCDAAPDRLPPAAGARRVACRRSGPAAPAAPVPAGVVAGAVARCTAAACPSGGGACRPDSGCAAAPGSTCAR